MICLWPVWPHEDLVIGVLFIPQSFFPWKAATLKSQIEVCQPKPVLFRLSIWLLWDGTWSSIDRWALNWNSLLFILFIVHFYFNLCLVVTKCLHSRTNLKKFPRSQPSQVVIKFSFQGNGQFEVATILGHINWNYLFYLSETFVLNGIL